MADTYLTYPYTFEGGRKAVAAQVNANFEAVKQFANGINLSIDELKAAISELKNKPVRQMLDIFYSFSAETPQGAYPLWTGETILYCKNLYPQFWKKLNNLSKLGNIISITSEEYEERLQTYGQCAAFFIDEINGHVRLPKITRFISGIEELSELAREEKAGLPNITGFVGTIVGYGGFTKGGAFQGSSNWSGAVAYHQGGTYMMNANFDASNVSAVYGASDTVQPPAVKLCLYLQVANSLSEVSTLDVKAIEKQMETALATLESAYQKYETDLQKIYAEVKEEIIHLSPVIKLKDITLQADAFIADDTHEGYPFRAQIETADAQEKTVPNVYFELKDAENGNFAPVADCSEGYINIYAKEKPQCAITIPSIVLE